MLAPALGADFKQHIVPALVLVAPSGWSQEQSVAWQAAAAQELSGIPADLLAMGTAAARKVADHPSKIIVAIHEAIGKRWRDRRAELAKLRAIDDVANGRRERKPWEPVPFEAEALATAEDMTELLGRLGAAKKATGPNPAQRVPADADYIAMGLTAEQVEASRRAAREEAQRPPSPAPAKAADTGPVVEDGGECPWCEAKGVTIGGGFAFCDAPGACGKVWQMVDDVAQAA